MSSNTPTLFVKRVLDRRTVVVLSSGGHGVDQTSTASNIAALIDAGELSCYSTEGSGKPRVATRILGSRWQPPVHKPPRRHHGPSANSTGRIR